MAGILVFGENVSITKQLFTAALSIKDKEQSICVAAFDVTDTTGFGGADKIVKLANNVSALQEDSAEAIAMLANQESCDVCLISGTLCGKDIAAKMAAYLKAGLVSSAQTIKIVADGVETTRLIYGGLAVAEEKTVFPAVITIESQSFTVQETTASCTIETCLVQSVNSALNVIQIVPIEKQGVDITVADKIVAVGRGLSKEEDMRPIEDLAKKIDAEIGCSRGIAEDFHWLPIERYIGISGKKVRPNIYLSIGISGQVQHVAGIRDSKIIAAIDTNENAPIFLVADYGIVGDMKDIIPLLLQEL